VQKGEVKIIYKCSEMKQSEVLCRVGGWGEWGGGNRGFEGRVFISSKVLRSEGLV
jgi:hypothetical protein